MPNDEALLSGTFDVEILKRRCDLSLWVALYEEALLQVARHQHARHVALLAAADLGRDLLDDWEEVAKDCQRAIHIVTSLPCHFEICLACGVYADETLRVRFDLRERAGIGMHYKGWIGSPPFVARTLPFPKRPNEANAIAVGAVREAISHLSDRQGSIPSREDLERVAAEVREEAERPPPPRFGSWSRRQR